METGKIFVDRGEWQRLNETNARLISRNRELEALLCAASNDHLLLNELREDISSFAREVVEQFAFHVRHNGAPHYSSGGISTLERAFQFAALPDPCPAPTQFVCQVEGCGEWAEGAFHTKKGYLILCKRHARKMNAQNGTGKPSDSPGANRA